MRRNHTTGLSRSAVSLGPSDYSTRNPSRTQAPTALRPLANNVIIPRKSAWQAEEVPLAIGALMVASTN